MLNRPRFALVLTILLLVPNVAYALPDRPIAPSSITTTTTWASD
jgi:hypothetical protein